MDRQRFSFYPIRVARGAYGGDSPDDQYDSGLEPFELGNGLTVEDVSGLIPDGEFNVYKSLMGSRAYDELGGINHSIVHRYAETDFANGQVMFSNQMVSRSRRMTEETAACLLLIRPVYQSKELFEGDINDAGVFTRIGFRGPITNDRYIPFNHRHFGVRTRDVRDLRKYVGKFHTAMAGESWKFRMSVQQFNAGHFQQGHWKAKFLSWMAALDVLYTTLQNKGSRVAKRRIETFLGKNTSIYPPGELISAYPDPNLTVGGILQDLYFLRNHVAHGERVPDSFFTEEGRPGGVIFQTDRINKVDVLFEALSFLIRRTLIRILDQELWTHFADASSTDKYFAQA